MKPNANDNAKALHERMRQARLRVRSVSFKSGGYVRLVPEDTLRRDWHNALISSLHEQVEEIDKGSGAGKMAGFALVAWSDDTRHRYGAIVQTPLTPLFADEVPAFVNSALNRYVMRITNNDVEEYLS